MYFREGFLEIVKNSTKGLYLVVVQKGTRRTTLVSLECRYN